MVCQTNDGIGFKRGCRGNPAPAPVLEEELQDRIVQYMNCPRLFIPKSIFHWHKIYKYYKDFPGASMHNITSQNSRFLQAYYVYEAHIDEIKSEQAKIGVS